MTVIWPCPDCDADLDMEFDGFWCPRCQHPVPFDLMRDGDPDDWRDDLIEQRAAASDH